MYSPFATRGLVLPAVLILLAAPARADQIDRVMVKDAPDIVAAVKGLKVKSVAVLKFQVKIGDAPATFKAGTEGAEMVHRLNNVLLLGLNANAPEYMLLTDAGDAAAAAARQSKTPIDWTTVEGRQRLFALSLPLAWNAKQKMVPEAYITGVVLASQDLKEVRIKLQAFTRADPTKLKDLGTLGTMVNGQPRGIHMDRAMLASMGQTFSTQRTLNLKTRDLLAPDAAAAADAAARTNKAPEANASRPPAGPVKLEVLIDNQVVPQEVDAAGRGSYKVSSRLAGSATQGQKVAFALTNTGSERLAVLLCVNGRNTIAIDNEDISSPDKPRAKFRMYVLDPGTRYDVAGFLKDAAGTLAPFDVLPEDESEAAFEALDPETRGQFQLFVYGKPPVLITPNVSPTTAVPPPALDAGAAMTDAHASSGLGSTERDLGKSGSLAAAQKMILQRTQLTSNEGVLTPLPVRERGLIVEGPRTTAGGKVEIVAFHHDEQPLDSLVISYYRK